jgi:hypothetical protein
MLYFESMFKPRCIETNQNIKVNIILSLDISTNLLSLDTSTNVNPKKDHVYKPSLIRILLMEY